MFLEEKIDKLKQKFPPSDFKVPFTEGSNILKSIEKTFIVAKDVSRDINNLRQHFNNWSDNIKNKIKIRSVDLDSRPDWLGLLDPHMNYWIVVARQSSPSIKHLVYDCKPKALIDLLNITQDDFFVIDKKYRWFTYFQVKRQTGQATLFKSGKATTPFEI